MDSDSNSDTTQTSLTRVEGGEISAVVPTDASLVVIYGPHLGVRHQLGGELSVGRDEVNSLTLSLPSVSRRHARFVERGGRWIVIDLGSTNGTFVNGREIDGEAVLANGDQVKIGSAIFKFIAGGNIEALYHEEVYRLTIFDGLTGVHNKRYFHEFLEREIARSARHRRALSVAIADVDHFKRLNDTHGHLVGDHVLAGLAEVMASEIRREELLARYGGEEFALVLPETALAEAVALCERIRARVEQHESEFDGNRIGATISIGVAEMEPDQGLAELVAAADAQLYRAKSAGRNRVEPRPGSR